MKYGSVCSGIEAATMAWHDLGWKPVFFSEIEPFPCSVLNHHYPNVPNLGDMTKLNERKEFNESTIDLLVGGTPCQSFSVAGLRKGLADPRGNLALIFLSILDRKRPKWVVWENVPGVLSSNKGKDFGAFLGALAQLGYGWAYRVLDAQYFGVPQRRRRVFVVGCLGDWRPAAAVLLERESMCGNPAPSRKKGEGSSSSVIKGAAIGRKPENGPQYGEVINDGSCYTLSTEVHAVAHSPITIDRAAFNQGTNAKYEPSISDDGIMPSLLARGPHAILNESRPVPIVPEISPTLKARDQKGPSSDGAGDGNVPLVKEAIPINTQIATRSNKLGEGTGLGVGKEGDPGFTLQAAHSHAISTDMQVRRLTPRECERLQGFPDDFTFVPHRNKPASDGPRYKALGNSMAVPVMRWIGNRIKIVEEILSHQ